MLVNIGKGIEFNVDLSAMGVADESKLHAGLAHYIRIGARNVLMDSHASITEKEYPDETARVAAARAMAEKKADAMARGEVRVAGTRAPRGDTIEAIVNKHARAAVLKWGNAQAKATLPNGDDKARAKWVQDGFDGWMTAYKTAQAAELRAIAEAEIAAKAKLGTVDIGALLTAKPGAGADDESETA
jgi:hypothetical protein